ncbi:MAG: hypothetical protein KH284_09435 [Clostridiales bacterium]|nr:hypothetical protein [Clostridiales bacterium]
MPRKGRSSEDMMTIDQAAARLSITSDCLKNALRQGLFSEFGIAFIPAGSTNYTYLIFRKRLEAYLGAMDMTAGIRQLAAVLSYLEGDEAS